MIYIVGVDGLDDCSDDCEDYVQLSAGLYFSEDCSDTEIATADLVAPQGCFELDNGIYEDISCTDSSLTVILYEDECDGTMINETTYEDGDCVNGAEYTISACGGSGGGGGDGSSNALQIGVGFTLILMGITQLFIQ